MEYVCCGVYERTQVPCSARLKLIQRGELLWVVTDPYYIDPRGIPSIYFILSFGNDLELKTKCEKKLTSPVDDKGLFLVLCKWEDIGIVGGLRIIKGGITAPNQIEPLPLLGSVEPEEYFR